MVTACIVLLYISYAVPIICLLIRGRNNIPHGPFWLGPIGLFANIVLLMWTAFTLIMYSLPFTKPVKAGSKQSPFPPPLFVIYLFHPPNSSLLSLFSASGFQPHAFLNLNGSYINNP